MKKHDLTGKKTAVIGGDARQLVIAEEICKKGAEVFLCGFDQLSLTEPGYRKVHIDDIPYEHLDAIIFPVSGISSTGEIKSSFSAENLKMDSRLLNRVSERCLIFSGIQTEWNNQSRKEFIYLFEEDEIAINNSIPTVEGIVWLIIQHTDSTIHGSHILLTGCGRVGLTAARVLHAMGAKVTALSTVKAEVARMKEIGVMAGLIKDLNHCLPEADVWINTIPGQNIISNTAMSFCPPGIFIIELASHPPKEQTENAQRKNINYLEAPSLPGLVAPRTAGEILAVAILEKINEKGE
ncbi:dipicolinate synthase subunit DpsA [Jeotgalibacillus salarius]|uniref:dipicolinate synthase subunit DpsA n=1 Tax=Jeotgalibacillus salarius TaxID=546023 RepID=UPI00141B2E24|nr:dipicolinate synthase subunit DpsA [Jeotgalibacillus salarius]